MNLEHDSTVFINRKERNILWLNVTISQPRRNYTLTGLESEEDQTVVVQLDWDLRFCSSIWN